MHQAARYACRCEFGGRARSRMLSRKRMRYACEFEPHCFSRKASTLSCCAGGAGSGGCGRQSGGAGRSAQPPGQPLCGQAAVGAGDMHRPQRMHRQQATISCTTTITDLVSQQAKPVRMKWDSLHACLGRGLLALQAGSLCTMPACAVADWASVWHDCRRPRCTRPQARTTAWRPFCMPATAGLA